MEFDLSLQWQRRWCSFLFAFYALSDMILAYQSTSELQRIAAKLMLVATSDPHHGPVWMRAKGKAKAYAEKICHGA
eukprot:193594-Pleurochrysis_carterae.AAC.1